MSFSKPNKIKTQDIFSTYRKSYKIQIPWAEILDKDVFAWMQIYEKSTNCSINLTMSCLLSLIPALCGPNTFVSTNDGSFKTSLNTFIFAVCDPGGGKSLTFNNVLQPVLDDYFSKKNVPLNIETYTIPGIQKHQIDNQGYGLITSDEGHRFLSQLKSKIAKGESDLPFLCKLWGGKGDSSTLSSGVRGFEKTSMSISMAIQPDPLLHELQFLMKNDGFLDRFLFITAKSHLYPTTTIKEFHHKLMTEEKMQDFVTCMSKVLEYHAHSGVVYKLDDDAQKLYDNMVDSYASFINAKYDSGKNSSIQYFKYKTLLSFINILFQYIL